MNKFIINKKNNIYNKLLPLMLHKRITDIWTFALVSVVLVHKGSKY